MANLEQFRSRIPDALSVTYIFNNSNLLFGKTENINKKLQRSSHAIALSAIFKYSRYYPLMPGGNKKVPHT